MIDRNVYPAGWNLERVQALIGELDAQTDEELAAEYEDEIDEPVGLVRMDVPADLVPAIRQMISKYQSQTADTVVSS